MGQPGHTIHSMDFFTAWLLPALRKNCSWGHITYIYLHIHSKCEFCIVMMDIHAREQFFPFCAARQGLLLRVKSWHEGIERWASTILTRFNDLQLVKKREVPIEILHVNTLMHIHS